MAIDNKIYVASESATTTTM